MFTRLRPLLALLKWSLGLGLIGGLLFGLYLVHVNLRGGQSGAEGSGLGESRRVPGDGVVELEDDEAERYGLEVQKAESIQWSERVSVYGRVVPNPQATAEIRSPFA